MIVYVQNNKKYIKQGPELISFSKVTGYKLSIRESATFLHTSNHQMRHNTTKIIQLQ